MSDWDISEIEPKPWLDKVLPACPNCGTEMEVDPDENWFSVSIDCPKCGFGGIVHPPNDISPLKGVIKEIRL